MVCDVVGGFWCMVEGVGDGVFGMVFEGGGEGQVVICVEIVQGQYLFECQVVFGEGVGFVEDYCVDVVQFFQYVFVCDQQVEFVQVVGGCGECGGCGQ